MLSRIAELVYWIGRFIERAEGVSRMIAAYHYSGTQLGSLEARSGLHDLIGAFGGHDDDEASFRSTATWWVTDAKNPSSVASCVRAARENARRAREVLSLEVWETLNGASASLDAMLSSGAPYEVVAERIPTHTRAFSGVVDTTTPRDEAWEILRLGTMLERAAMTLRALLIGAQASDRLPPSDPLALHAWTVTLRACSALDAYRRSSDAIPQGAGVADLLLRAGTCPRSVLFALREVQSVLPLESPALRIIDRARGHLIAEPGDDGIPGLADLLLVDCEQIHELIVGEWRGRWESA